MCALPVALLHDGALPLALADERQAVVFERSLVGAQRRTESGRIQSVGSSLLFVTCSPLVAFPLAPVDETFGR